MIAGKKIAPCGVLRGLAIASLGLMVGLATVSAGVPPASADDGARIAMPMIDPALGRSLFVRRACVVCHSVNGVGGRLAPALDADPTRPVIDVADFSARMWRGAGAMVWLQTLELGYQIELNGDELAHIAGFAADAEEQALFEENQVPGRIMDLLLNEPYSWPSDWFWDDVDPE